jgi:beta-glucosidase
MAFSYTTFEYADLEATVTGRADDGDLAVETTCRITNTGQVRGKEVVQLYVGDPDASVARPLWELKGFAKPELDPGESRSVTLRLDGRDLSYWSTSASDWVLEPGEFSLAVGASSRDLRLTTTIEVSAPPLPIQLDGMATLQEWLAHPTGSELVREAVGTDEAGRPRGILGNDELITVIGNFPIRTLAAFPGLGLDHATVDELLQRVETPVEQST